VQDNNSLSRDLSRTVFIAAVKHSNQDTWEQLFEFYKKTLEPSERIKALYCLGATSNTDVLQRYSNFVVLVSLIYF